MNPLGEVRALRAFNMHRNGVKLVDISSTFHVTKERARQLTKLGAEIERRMLSTDPWDELHIRVRNALVNDGCGPTIDEVIEHFKTRDRKRIVSFGVKAFAELNAWLVRHGKEPLE